MDHFSILSMMLMYNAWSVWMLKVWGINKIAVGNRFVISVGRVRRRINAFIVSRA
jgi:hypothetical protein